MLLYDGSYLLIYEFESWGTGVCSPHVVSLCDFAYYVVGLRACSCYGSYPFGILCLSAIRMNILLAVYMFVGIVV